MLPQLTFPTYKKSERDRRVILYESVEVQDNREVKVNKSVSIKS